MFSDKLLLPAAILLLTAAPAAGQRSYPTTIGSTPAPTPGITLGIAAAATANGRPVPASATAKTRVGANPRPGPLRSSTR